MWVNLEAMMRKTWAMLTLAAVMAIPLAAQTRDQANKVMKKASFVELHDGMVIGAGIYE